MALFRSRLRMAQFTLARSASEGTTCHPRWRVGLVSTPTASGIASHVCTKRDGWQPRHKGQSSDATGTPSSSDEGKSECETRRISADLDARRLPRARNRGVPRIPGKAFVAEESMIQVEKSARDRLDISWDGLPSEACFPDAVAGPSGRNRSLRETGSRVTRNDATPSTSPRSAPG